MSERKPNPRLDGWGDVVGMWRGSWFPVLHVTPEANAIAHLLCERRDLWKQNEAGEIAALVQALLNDIDARKTA